MSKKFRFTGLFDKQHGKGAQALLNSASHHFYHILWSLPRKWSWKKSLLLIWEIFGLLVNTLDADENFPVPNRDNLTIPIQMLLSQKQKISLNFWLHFWNLDSILNILEQKMILTAFVFPKLRTVKTWLEKCLRSPVPEDASTSNMVNMAEHSSHLHHMVFIIFIDHCQVNWVRKSLYYWHAKSWDCLLTHWPPMKSVLFLIETI